MSPWLTVAAIAVLLLGAIPVLRLLGDRNKQVLGGLSLAALFLAAASWTQSRPDTAYMAPDARPQEVPSPGYVGSDSCESCHPQAYATWHASYHRTMTTVATPENVVAPFDGRTVEAEGRQFTLDQVGDSFWVTIHDPNYLDDDGQILPVRRRIVMLTGSHHEQDFWFESGYGNSVAHLPVVWRIAEQKFLPDDAVYLWPPDQSFVQSMQSGTWNTNCIKCHATNGRRNGDEKGVMNTEVTELGIACEACHGPGEAHVQANRSPARRYQLHFGDDGDPTVVQPERLEVGSEVCGQCHMVQLPADPATEARRNTEGFAYRPGDDLFETRIRAQQAAPRWFWPDGHIRVSGREFNGLLETPCHTEGTLSCLSCHVMHPDEEEVGSLEAWADDQLKPGMRGDDACIDCHDGFETQDHTRHAADSEGARCMNCHMPNTTYGLLKAMRTHVVSSPSVQTELETGRPNACNLCHLDQSLAWTADQLGEPVPDDDLPAGVRYALTGDAGLRALVAWHMGWEPAWQAAGADWMVPYLAHLLKDPYDAVRFIAERSLRSHEGYEDMDYDFLADDPAPQADAIKAAWPGTLRPDFDALAAQRDDRPVGLAE